MKNQRGITLINLIIVVILLFILAIVTINVLNANNIVDTAENTVDEFKAEQTRLAIMQGIVDQFAFGDDISKQDVLNNLKNNSIVDKAKSDGTVQKDGYKYQVNEKENGDYEVILIGKVVQLENALADQVNVGDYIIYDPTLDVTNQSLLSYTSPVGTLKVKNGNTYLVNEDGTSTYTYNGAYNLINENGNFVTTGYTEEADVSGNGYSSQSFTATSGNNIWRVLDVNKATGVVKIVPETPIKTTSNANFYLRGLRGYKNAVTELNNISEIFGHGQGANGAESITVEQVNALTGYTVTPPSSSTAVGSVGNWYNTYYYYEKGDNLANNIKSMLFKTGYWLASCCVETESYVYFKVRYMNISRVFDYNMYYVGSNGREYDSGNISGVMPVVTLNDDIVKNGGDGSQGNPWTFQTQRVIVQEPNTTEYTYNGMPIQISANISGASSYTAYYSTSSLNSSNYTNGSSNSISIGPDAGTYTVYYYVKSNDSSYNDASGSFSIVINKAQLTITTGSSTKVYDGAPLTNSSVVVEGLIGGDTVTVVATGSQTSVGSSPNTYSITWNGTAKENNYNIVENLGTLTVTAAPVAPTPSVPTPPDDRILPSMTAKGKDITQGKTAEITVTLPTDASGRVWVTINNVDYDANSVNR